MSDAMNAALAYAARGWRVLPLHWMLSEGQCSCRKDACGKSAAKHPRVPDWQNDASTDPATIRRWWEMWPEANVGVLTGALENGRFLVALDIDPKSGGNDSFDDLVREFGALPNTMEVLTGSGGRHFYFEHTAPLPKRIGVRPGIDIIAGGEKGRGQLVAPPSVHQSGRTYAWELSSPDEACPPPAWLVALAIEGKPRAKHPASASAGERSPASGTRYANGALVRACESIRSAPEGTRNDTLNREVYSVFGLVGLDRERAQRELEAAARDAGLHPDEIAKTLSSAMTAGALAPREAPARGSYAPARVSYGLEYDAPYAEVVTADRFVRSHANELAYCHERGWFAYRETHWSHDELRPFKLAQDFARERAERALRDGADHRTVTMLLKNSTLRAVVDLSRAQLAVRQAAFDSDAWLFNCASGTIDLRTGEHRKHQHEDRCTKLSPVAFDPDAVCPTWDAFLERVLPDADVRAFVQRLAGLAMLGEQREHVLPVFYGRGANGKSTFLEAVQYVFGDYAKAVPSDVLMQREGEQHPTEKAQLLGLRLAVCSETKQGRSFDEGTVKSLTGGDRISARFMHRDFFEFTPTHSLVLATNHKPRIKGTDDGIWRRLLLVPWVVTVPVAERDTALGEKLRAEAPGILRWCVEGFRAWHAQGLAAPESVKLATKGYRSESDVLGRFIEERCVRLEVARVQAGALYAAFTAWCAANGESAMTLTAFGRALSEEHGFEKTKSSTVFWLRLGLQAQSEAREPDGLGGLGGLGGFQETSHARAQESTGGKPSRPSHPPAAPVAVLPRPSANDTRKLAVGDYAPSGRRGEHL